VMYKDCMQGANDVSSRERERESESERARENRLGCIGACIRVTESCGGFAQNPFGGPPPLPGHRRATSRIPYCAPRMTAAPVNPTPQTMTMGGAVRRGSTSTASPYATAKAPPPSTPPSTAPPTVLGDGRGIDETESECETGKRQTMRDQQRVWCECKRLQVC
jgi:hypothetical protein